MVRRRLLLLVLTVAIAGGCAEGTSLDASPPATIVTTAAQPDPSTTSTTTSAFPVPTTSSGPTTTVAPMFSSSVVAIDERLAARMAPSWRPGCPVPLADLRYLTLRHWGMDGAVHDGELVVHVDHAATVVGVFAELFAARFPIERMRLVDDYGGDDQASMRANNTSAFNCREVAGRPGVLSNHSRGAAIDLNPLVNPWVAGRSVDPPEGAPYADRSQRVPGGIYPGDVVTRAFARIGWGWGGDWPSSKDWQHFSASGS